MNAASCTSEFSPNFKIKAETFLLSSNRKSCSWRNCPLRYQYIEESTRSIVDFSSSHTITAPTMSKRSRGAGAASKLAAPLVGPRSGVAASSSSAAAAGDKRKPAAADSDGSSPETVLALHVHPKGKNGHTSLLEEPRGRPLAGKKPLTHLQAVQAAEEVDGWRYIEHKGWWGWVPAECILNPEIGFLNKDVGGGYEKGSQVMVLGAAREGEVRVTDGTNDVVWVGGEFHGGCGE